MGKFLRLCLSGLLLVGLVTACGPADEAPKAGQSSEQPEPDPFANETTSQRKARLKAEELLAASAYSSTGLIKQLETEQVSTEDATYAADAVGVDWRDQAAKKAKEYLDDSSYSREELREKLRSDGFTEDEAEYGVSQFFE